MADWVTGKVTKVQNWTDALFSLTVHAPCFRLPPGNSPSLALKSTANASSAPTPMLTRPIIPIWVLHGHRPRWQIKPTIGGTETVR